MKVFHLIVFSLVLHLISNQSLSASALTPSAAPSTNQQNLPAPSIPTREDFYKIAQLVALEFTEKPAGLEKLFHPSFFQKFSPSQLKAILADHYQRYGRVKKINIVRQDSPFTGKVAFHFGGDILIQATITIAAESPHQVQGLFLGLAIEQYQNFENLNKTIAKLPGQLNFCLARLDQGTTVLNELNAGTPLAIASAFKLYVLGSLLEKNWPWDKIVSLEESAKSLPGGSLQDWPVGAPITVHTLAALMISQSDNTAADQLINLIGRETIENNLTVLGNSHAKMNIPFLTTNEFFRLKSNQPLLRQYLQATTPDKRELLKYETPLIQLKQIINRAQPTALDSIEWFASADDLIQLLSYLNSKNDSAALGLLSINPGLDIPEDRFSWAGFKGGSEPGAMSLNWLLKTTGGKIYALSMTWNNTAAPIDETLFLSLAQSAIYLIEP